MTDRRLLLRAWLFALSRLEAGLLREQAAARNAMIRGAASEYERAGHPPAHVFVAHQRRTRDNLARHYRRTAPVFAGMALRQVKSRPSREVKRAQSAFEALMEEWVSTQALTRAKLIADTDRDDVIDAIGRGLAEGEGTAAIASKIRKVSSLTPSRAATVARTETHAAATYGSIQGVRQAEEELGVRMTKEWLATNDDRTRPDHRAADGQQVALGEKFTVGGEPMDRPGDPSASAANLVNCRCAIIYTEQ